jgi:hypothetical protein
MSSTTSSDSEFGFKTDAGDTLTDLPPAGGVKTRIVKRESELSRFDVDGDGKFTESELRSIDQALQHSKETISLLKRVAAGLSILLLLIAIALGSATSVMVYDAIREPTTDVAPSTTDGGAVSLMSPAGSQVQVVQSAAEIMLGMLPTFVQMNPLQAIKALPESIVLWNPFTQGWLSLKPTLMHLRSTDYAVTIGCASGHQIVIHDEMHGTVFQTAAALSDWNALVAENNGTAPDPRSDNETVSRHHFCAACVPIELKSILMNDNLDRAFALFDHVTQNRSCEAVTGVTGHDAFASNVVAVCADSALQHMTYSPQVCLPNPADTAARARREEGKQDGEWASHRRDEIKGVLGRSRNRRSGATPGKVVDVLAHGVLHHERRGK